MSEKISIYGNFVVKYQSDIYEWNDKYAIPLNKAMTNFRRELEKTFNTEGTIKITPSYHTNENNPARVYYKLEMIYPSFENKLDIFRVDKI